MTALELAKRIRKKELSVVEAVKLSLDAIHASEKEIHAFITVAEEEELMKTAGEVQQGIEEGRLTSPLAGVPIAVKDNICTKGLRTTCGSRMLEDFVPGYDATVVRRLRGAGCIIIGKTNMDEFAMGSTTETSYFGATRNPHDTTRVPGGSSGGSAAAVASGDVFLALGSDTGGSIRQPAAYCGLYGLKPTYGAVSRYGLVAYASSMDQIGPMTGSVEDQAALLDVISGWDPCDISRNGEGNEISFLSSVSTVDHGEKPLAGTRIGVPAFDGLLDDGGGDAEVIRRSVRGAASFFEKMGATVEELTIELPEMAVPAYYILACAEASSNLSRFDGVRYGYRAPGCDNVYKMMRRSRSEGFGEEVKRRILLGTYVLSEGYYDAYYLQALRVRRMIREAYDRAFDKYDMLLGPVAPTLPPAIGEMRAARGEFEGCEDTLAVYKNDCFTVTANLLGLPAISFPCGHIGGCPDEAALPVGAQLTGPYFSERKLLQAVRLTEKAEDRK